MENDSNEADWPEACHIGIEAVIARFRRELPDWWYSLGECQVSCDASCSPTSLSEDIDLIPMDPRFDHGFHADVPQPSELKTALLIVLHDAKAARLRARGDPENAARMQEVADLLREAHGMTDDDADEN